MRVRAAWMLLRVTDSNGCLLEGELADLIRSLNADENEKPPAAVAGGGLGVKNHFVMCQASLPAYGLEFIIRMEGADTALHWTGVRLELAAIVSMTLIEVNQSAKGYVNPKMRQRLQIL